MKDLIRAVKNETPPFNDKLLIGLRKQEMANITEFIATRYMECASAISPDLKLLSYTVLSPIERLRNELRSRPKRKNIVNIRVDEAVLVEFKFSFMGSIFTNLLYIPYIYEDSSLLIGGTRCECQLSATEKIFSVRTRSNGVTIKVIRSPISFWKNTLHVFQEVVSGEQYVAHITTCKIHYRKATTSKRRVQATVIHYLMCKYELGQVISMFGFHPDSVKFYGSDNLTPDRYYFKAQNLVISKSPVLISCDKELFDTNRLFKDIVGTLSYILGSSRTINYTDLVTDSTIVFRILLGRIIYSANTNKLHALSYMNKHIESTDPYLDQYTMDIMHQNGVDVKNIYELLVFMINSIDQITVSCPNNNMYNKRIEIITNTIADNLVSTLYYRIYSKEKKSDTSYMNGISVDVFNLNPNLILRTLRNSDNVRFRPSVYSDNWLLSTGCKLIKRLSASVKKRSVVGAKTPTKRSSGSSINAPVNKFHPSMMETESAVGFSSNPGVNALINPYAVIDDHGGFERGSHYGELIILDKCLPK